MIGNIEKDRAHAICKNLIASFLMSKDFDKLCDDRVFKPERFKKNHQRLLDVFNDKLVLELTREQKE